MTIKQLSNKIELSFWHLTINLLSESNLFRQTIKWGYCKIPGIEHWEKIKQRIYLVSFGTLAVITLIVVGMVSYLFLGGFNDLSQESIIPLTMPTNGQRNILVISVDDLRHKNPSLAGLWLVVYIPEKTNIIFAPIFPNPLESRSHDNSKLVESFALNENDSPSQNFFEQLHQKQLWWHGYLVVDSYAVAEAVKFFNHASGKEQNPIHRISWNAGSSPTLNEQTELLNNLCMQASEMTIETNLGSLLRSIRPHLHTDLDMIPIIQDWRSLISSNSDLVCEFPLQRASNP